MTLDTLILFGGARRKTVIPIDDKIRTSYSEVSVRFLVVEASDPVSQVLRQVTFINRLAEGGDILHIRFYIPAEFWLFLRTVVMAKRAAFSHQQRVCDLTSQAMRGRVSQETNDGEYTCTTSFTRLLPDRT